jgi:hypothetical protein
MQWLSDLMNWFLELFASLNQQLEPFARGISDLRSAPIYVVGALLLGVGLWIWRRVTAHARERAHAEKLVRRQRP